MTTFGEQGFLADEFSFFTDVVNVKHGELISICMELNKRAQAFQYSLAIHNEHPSEIICSILFSRVLTTYQGALLLSQKGMKHQIQMLIRCILEPLFPLIAISKELNFVNIFVLSEEHERLKGINKIIRYKERNNDRDDLQELKNLADSIKQHILTEKIVSVSAYECAQKAGLQDYYDTLYSFMSITLHASPRSLEEALEMDPEKVSIKEIKNEPDLEMFDAHLTTLADCLLKAVLATAVIFGVDEPKFVQETIDQLQGFPS
ncbi:DUF5677 domain-containing protein [Geothrix paludis]|uniref:DUF5677 domain-containing protein n=1 Tax=Geothrix paludis TaxID=2922722 RepID=UPI001FAE150A|nr:DUF5677 domain-containing protein [Geothrix paludis]